MKRGYSPLHEAVREPLQRAVTNQACNGGIGTFQEEAGTAGTLSWGLFVKQHGPGVKGRDEVIRRCSDGQ